MIGLGYLDYCQKRIDEGLSTQQTKTGFGFEDPGQERFVVYFARTHIIDHQTGIEARGLLKIGRAKFATALQRSRNQPGCDFRIYAEIVCETNNQIKELEKKVEKFLVDKHVELTQNQRELYDIKDDELRPTIKAILNHVYYFEPKEVCYYGC
ncbi:hypothetical protein I899_gp116 [Pelagibacter phage HTVC008M]|jgi:hypothetical protein|uniref:hypothetical protein n=1 Tax=Pelagibacter phage HTVC008M TaxID=1283076 RepID=UPI0002B29241|nr:hypothetical protein I899_gp116 [Pelagibacter phage HTVC008M]AGE60450.1 hypothetical protein [Pelagibacter phage HTVC008M]|tara:strand:+ start:350 stop:808 length:459 start_codon:yes stop_codon:yes gene_type:complete